MKFTREGKTDFTEHFKNHKKMMVKDGCEVDAIIKVRHHIHKFPEGRFTEVNTQKTLKDNLIGFGLDSAQIKPCAGTGLVIDIRGKGPEVKDTSVKSIAIRADMDGLFMKENNPDLAYRTTTEYAHMCGHDGHMAMALACAQVAIKKAANMPKNKFVRLLFQPAEEGPGGAAPMIKEGCLEGIDEVYGLHNFPNFDEGDIRVIEGGFFAGIVTVKIKIIG